MYRFFFKPGIDLGMSLCLLIILSPIIILTILILAIVNRGDIFFIQQRPGLNGKPFKIIKFKTMRDIFNEEGKLLADEFRITQVGKIIRATSIDELLQLINVLKGDMSFVGPRPLLMQYLDRYTKEQAKRHCVKPGITGWAQVNGRNALDWDTKFQLDLEYVSNQTFALDLKILWMTIINVLLRRGINSDGQVTMQEFMGEQVSDI